MPRTRSAKAIPIPEGVPKFLTKLLASRVEKDPSYSQARLAEDLHFERAHFYRLVSGTLGIGTTAVARAVLFLDPVEAKELLETYLIDEMKQVESERARLAIEYGVQKQKKYHPSVKVSIVPS